MEKRVCGALPSPHDDNDIVLEDLAQSSAFRTLPSQVDLRRKGQVVRDQGQRGTCAAFAASVIKEIQEEGVVMSPEFIYFHRNSKPASGMYGRNVFQILQTIGSVPEKLCPYQDRDLQVRPDPEVYTVAKQYRIESFVRIKSVEGLRRALFELGPCYIQLPLYNTSACFWRPANSSEEFQGGHALAAVGYDETGFILQNSWGAEWNGNGCVIFPYDEWSAVIECWASIDGNYSPSSERKKKCCAVL